MIEPFCFGKHKIAPIFFNTLEDSGALPIECDVSNLHTGDVVDVRLYEGAIRHHDTGELRCTFALKNDILLDEVQAGAADPAHHWAGPHGWRPQSIGARHLSSIPPSGIQG